MKTEHDYKIDRLYNWLKTEHGDCETDAYWKIIAEKSINELKTDDPILYETM